MNKSMVNFICLRDKPALLDAAARWFHQKWGLPLRAYTDSMRACIAGGAGVPQWYLLLDGSGAIIGGCGVIDNDFHDRKDLSPNICAVYVEAGHRGRGLARLMLGLACADMGIFSVKDIYLSTDHERFYEKCGWDFYCMAREDGGAPTRIYHRKILP